MELSEIVRATNYEQQVYELIKWTTGKGWTDNLVAAIKGDRPDSPPVQRLDSGLERAAEAKETPASQKVSAEPPPPPGTSKIVVVLGEPSLPAEAAKGVSQEPMRELLKALRARGVPLAPPEQWADGWAARESPAGLAHFLDDLPLFVRTLAPPTGTLVKELKELLKSLLGPFDEQDAARLARCPRSPVAAWYSLDRREPGPRSTRVLIRRMPWHDCSSRCWGYLPANLTL